MAVSPLQANSVQVAPSQTLPPALHIQNVACWRRQARLFAAAQPIHPDAITLRIRDVRQWVQLALDVAAQHLAGQQPCEPLSASIQTPELALRFCGLRESQRTNRDYRSKDKPTNVLSFPADLTALPDEIRQQLPVMPLGDLLICADVVFAEALAQRKPPLHHLAHLVIHGTLHLLGYDHDTSEQEAEMMEQLEISALQQLDIANPYE